MKQVFSNTMVKSITHIDPPRVVSSEEIEVRLADNLQRFGMHPHFIQHLAGVETRRFYDSGRQPSKHAAEVGHKALDLAEIAPTEVDLLLNCSIYKDYIEPATAALIHGRMGLQPDCFSFDVGNACLGFISGLCVAGQMIERGVVKYALLTSCETAGDLYDSTIEKMADPNISLDDFRARFATLTLGSAATAVVVCHRDLAPDALQFCGGVTLSATDQSMLCVGENEDIRTDASALLVEGTALARRTYQRAQEELGWTDGCFDHYFLHQVGKVHNAAIIDALNVPEERAPSIFPSYGNSGSNTLTLNISKCLEDDVLESGDRLGLFGIGSGISCAMMEMRV